MAEPTVAELTANLHRMSGEMQKNRENAEGFTAQFTDLLQTLIPIGAAMKGMSWTLKTMGLDFGVAQKALGATTAELYRQKRLRAEEAFELRAKLAKEEISVAHYRDVRAANAANKDSIKAQFALTRELDRVGRGYLSVITANAGIAVKTLHTTYQYNEALKEANAGFGQRYLLMQSMARVQGVTGSASQVVADAARALTRYNLQNKSTFEANLKTVVMLHDAVGLSADEAAHLASVVENYAKASFQEVADVVATIVDQTSLAAAEVKNLGIELTRALGVIRPGASTTLPQVIQALSGYEGALKEVTGRVGSFQKFVSQFTTPEGMMQAGVLGVTPEMIATKEGIDTIMSRFEQFTQRMVGQSEGYARVLKLEAVARTMNLTREEVSEMIRAMEIRRGQMIEEITLEKRFKDEAGNLNQGVTRLVSGLMILGQQGLYPIVFVLSKAINFLAGLVQGLISFKEVGYVAMGVFTLATIVLVSKLKGVVWAFLEVAWAAGVAAKRLKDQALTNYLGPLPAGGSRLTGLLGAWKAALVPVGASLVGPLIGIAAAFASLLVIVYYISKYLKYLADSEAENKRVRQAIMMRSQELQNRNRAEAYLSARYGNTEHFLKHVELKLREMQTQARFEGDSVEGINARVTAEADVLKLDYVRALQAGVIANAPIGKGLTAEETKKYNAALLEAITNVSEILKKTLRTTEAKHKADEESKNEFERFGDQDFIYRPVPWSPLGGQWRGLPGSRQ